MQALTISPPPAPRPFEARRSLRLVRSLIDDPEKTELVFELIEAVGGRGDEPLFQAFAASAAGRRLLAEQPELIAVLGDRAALARLPAESLGRAYLSFAEARDFAADGLQQVSDRSVIGELNASLDPERRWFYRRITAMHDLWHVLTGYATDEPGESALLAFSLGQGLGGRGFRLLLAAAACKGSFADGFAFQRGLASAWRRGRRSAPLAEARYEELLPLPLQAVRQNLRIPSPRAST
ncbi:MAG: Coq4 family protein [Myxococcota bacterium]